MGLEVLAGGAAGGGDLAAGEVEGVALGGGELTLGGGLPTLGGGELTLGGGLLTLGGGELTLGGGGLACGTGEGDGEGNGEGELAWGEGGGGTAAGVLCTPQQCERLLTCHHSGAGKLHLYIITLVYFLPCRAHGSGVTSKQAVRRVLTSQLMVQCLHW